MARAAKWPWVGMAVVVVAACRAHDDVCSGDACDRELRAAGGAPSSGAGGEPAIPDPGPFSGEAGQRAAGASCADDSECDNGVRCDGAERCTKTGCEAGPAVDCDHGMTCDGATGNCAYRRPSPWLLVKRADGVDGLPVRELGARPLLELWRDPSPQPWSSVELSWSRDGAVAFFVKHEGQLSYSYWYMRFGDAAPSALAPLPDVPNLLSTAAGPDSASSSSHALSFDPFTGAFLTSLHDDRDATRLVATVEEGLERATFCGNRPAWLEEYTDGRAFIAALEGGNIERRLLAGSPPVLISDDRGLLVSRARDSASTPTLVLEPCDTSLKWSVELPGATGAEFAGNGYLLLVELASGGQQVFDIERSEAVQARCQSDAGSLTYLPLSGENFGQPWPLLAQRGATLLLADVSSCQDGPVPLGLPEGAELARAGDRVLVGLNQLLAWTTRDDGTRDLLLQTFHPLAAPRVVASVAPGSSARWFVGADAQNPWLLHVHDGRSTISDVLLDTVGGPLVERLDVEGEVTWLEPAGDESGVALTIDGALYWSAARPLLKYAEPVLIAESLDGATFQPWR